MSRGSGAQHPNDERTVFSKEEGLSAAPQGEMGKPSFFKAAKKKQCGGYDHVTTDFAQDRAADGGSPADDQMDVERACLSVSERASADHHPAQAGIRRPIAGVHTAVQSQWPLLYDLHGRGSGHRLSSSGVLPGQHRGAGHRHRRGAHVGTGLWARQPVRGAEDRLSGDAQGQGHRAYLP